MAADGMKEEGIGEGRRTWDSMRFTKGAAREKQAPRGGRIIVSEKRIVTGKETLQEKIVTEKEIP